ncbi:hypothetical protein P7K49_024724, partial [Saguinus oedipus]
RPTLLPRPAHLGPFRSDGPLPRPTDPGAEAHLHHRCLGPSLVGCEAGVDPGLCPSRPHSPPPLPGAEARLHHRCLGLRPISTTAAWGPPLSGVRLGWTLGLPSSG